MSFHIRTSKYRHVFCDQPKPDVSLMVAKLQPYRRLLVYVPSWLFRTVQNYSCRPPSPMHNFCQRILHCWVQLAVTDPIFSQTNNLAMFYRNASFDGNRRSTVH